MLSDEHVVIRGLVKAMLDEQIFEKLRVSGPAVQVKDSDSSLLSERIPDKGAAVKLSLSN